MRSGNDPPSPWAMAGQVRLHCQKRNAWGGKPAEPVARQVAGMGHPKPAWSDPSLRTGRLEKSSRSPHCNPVNFVNGKPGRSSSRWIRCCCQNLHPPAHATQAAGRGPGFPSAHIRLSPLRLSPSVHISGKKNCLGHSASPKIWKILCKSRGCARHGARSYSL
jgi:hypothetical protein